MTLPLTPAEVMLQAARSTLRAGRLPPTEVVARQMSALAWAGYRLQPGLADGGAELLLAAARRAIRTGHFAPAAVIARQLDAVSEAGYSFVRDGDDLPFCESYVWGPDSFQACARCGVSYWKHPGGAGHVRGAHRAVSRAASSPSFSARLEEETRP